MSGIPGPVVYISIGNSDDKLSTVEWEDLWEAVARLIDRFVESEAAPGACIVGSWMSHPDSWWVNACWAVAIPATVADAAVMDLRAGLRAAAQAFRQDSIAWAMCPNTDFLTPA